MGQYFNKDTFTASDHSQFRSRLQTQIRDLKDIIRQPGFSSGPASIGAELELYMIDRQAQPAPIIDQIMDRSDDQQLTEELNQYNIEYNLSPVSAKGTPFANMELELLPALEKLSQHAQTQDARLVSIGILPSLEKHHLDRRFLTDRARYRALANQVVAPDGEPFEVNINGIESLKMPFDEVTLEGANTSFQVHLKVSAERFKHLYNAAQLITPLVTAISANSPMFMGKALWHETRIALFKQATDIRVQNHNRWKPPARVSFGQGWVRTDAWELFAENVALYRPLMPFVSPDNQPFYELGLHHGTVWSWNRAVFEPLHGGHLRIEFRAFPAGPTVSDMMANAALAIGLTQALSERSEELICKLPFHYAEYNFYRAAQEGMNACVLWPTSTQHQLQESPIHEVISGLLPAAADGLKQLGVDHSEIDRLLSIIDDRLSNQQTGAQWQIETFEKLCKGHDRSQAMMMMLQHYIENSQQGHPVSQW